MFGNFFNFFLRSPCPLCDRPVTQTFCIDCQRRLERDRLSNPSEFWKSQRVFAWGHYTDTLKRTISLLKYDRQPQVAVPLGEALAGAWINSSLAQSVAIVPIPLHREKQQQRGYNQAELIARSFCRVTGDRLYANGLARIRPTEALFNLSPKQREQTLKQVFEIGTLQNCHAPILLIDDIYTTGATTRAAIDVLHRHGLRVAGVAVIAKTPKN